MYHSTPCITSRHAECRDAVCRCECHRRKKESQRRDSEEEVIVDTISSLTPEERKAIRGRIAPESEYWGSVYDLQQDLSRALLTIDEMEAENARLRSACQFVKAWFQKLESGLPEDDPLRGLRMEFHKPIHAALDEALKGGPR